MLTRREIRPLSTGASSRAVFADESPHEAIAALSTHDSYYTGIGEMAPATGAAPSPSACSWSAIPPDRCHLLGIRPAGPRHRPKP